MDGAFKADAVNANRRDSEEFRAGFSVIEVAETSPLVHAKICHLDQRQRLCKP